MDEHPPGKLIDYKITKCIGKGAFGVVYQVKRVSDGSLLAMKRIRMKSLTPRERIDSLNEIRLMASLNHPNIIKYVDSFYEELDMSLYLVMEIAEGGDLSTCIEKARSTKLRFGEEIIWKAFVQIARGLDCMHGLGIIHRDIKAANCLLDCDGNVKIGDFNVSTIAKDGTALIQAGTPLYMSPEIIEHKPYTCKSDIWSVGVVLYELCCLRHPFRGAAMSELQSAVKSGLFKPIPKEYGSDLSYMISKLLCLNPHRRFSTKQIMNDPIFMRHVHEDDEIASTSPIRCVQLPALVLPHYS